MRPRAKQAMLRDARYCITAFPQAWFFRYRYHVFAQMRHAARYFSFFSSSPAQALFSLPPLDRFLRWSLFDAYHFSLYFAEISSPMAVMPTSPDAIDDFADSLTPLFTPPDIFSDFR